MNLAIVVPVKDGGALWRQILPRLLDQQTGAPLEVVVVDSGSRDGSREYLEDMRRRHPALRVLDVPPAAFQHGRTRNLAIAATRADWIALTTQDATPADAGWLARLVAAARQAPDIAGVTGRQQPYPDAPLCVRREIVSHFEHLDRQPRLFRRDARYETDTAYRQAAHFFSNNNALIRRAYWERQPFPEVPFGEDQLWIETALKAGQAKAYAHDAVVLHSHRYTLRACFARHRTESAYYRAHFGYNLVPSLWKLPLLALRAARADWRFYRGRPEWRTNPADLLYSSTLNAARLAGFYAGGRDAGQR